MILDLSSNMALNQRLNAQKINFDLEIGNFFDAQGRTRIYAEAYLKYVAGINLRRTQRIGKRTIYKSKLNFHELPPGNIDRLSRDVCRLIGSQKSH
jgi:hypothetical protein